MAAADQLVGLMNLIKGVQGSNTQSTTTTSGGQSTQQTQLSDAAVQEQIKRILSGSGGVKDIGNSARRAGLYNSTSEELLLGNLYATAANQGEIARAPIVTTSAPQTKVTNAETPGAGIGAVAATIGGAAALNALLGSDVAKSAGNSLLSAIGLGSTPGKKNDILDETSSAISFGAGPDTAVGITGSIGSSSPGSSFSGDSFGSQVGQGLPGVNEGQVGATGNYQSGGGFDLVGSVGSALSGFFSGGGLGGLVGAVTGGTGSNGANGSTTGGSIICTALMEKGLLSAEQYAAGDKYIKQVSLITKVGYYSWAQGIAWKIRNGNKFWTKVCLPFARGRTALLASRGTFVDHVVHPLGTLTKFVGEPVCWMIGMKVVSWAKFQALAKVKPTA